MDYPPPVYSKKEKGGELPISAPVYEAPPTFHDIPLNTQYASTHATPPRCQHVSYMTARFGRPVVIRVGEDNHERSFWIRHWTAIRLIVFILVFFLFIVPAIGLIVHHAFHDDK